MARARSLWSGSLSFGLVNVPVSLVSAVRDQAIHFHQIHKRTHERLHVSYVCTKEKTPATTRRSRTDSTRATGT
jgi:DNA end-binding protein Ku